MLVGVEGRGVGKEERINVWRSKLFHLVDLGLFSQWFSCVWLLPNHTCPSSFFPKSLLSTFTKHIKQFCNYDHCTMKSPESSNETVTRNLQS